MYIQLSSEPIEVQIKAGYIQLKTGDHLHGGDDWQSLLERLEIGRRDDLWRQLIPDP